MKVFKIFAFLIKSGKLFHIKGPIQKNCFLSHVSLAKRIIKLRRVISSAYPTVWGEFKNLIQIIRTSVIDKIVDYSIYALINPFTGAETIYQSKLILSNFRQKRMHLFLIICISFFIFPLRLEYQAEHA